ncbi:putative component of type VI protein secretion system [Clostridium beijerinckii]|nr:putative component of type VI protein secretion system [Clostridium beijerinckii]NSA88602.1 putative component of type VI protein secretion system [Clostridium beijerinckii]
MNLNNKINNSTNKLVEHWFTEINKDNFMDYIKKLMILFIKKLVNKLGEEIKMKAVFL